MKFSTISTFAVIVLTSVQAVPLAEADAKVNCYRVGEPCAKLKIRESKANCLRVGEPCAKAKRDALAEAKVNCYRFGEPCAKFKRAADLLDDILDSDDSEAIASGHEGYLEDGAYAMAKREALAIREAVAEAEAIALPEQADFAAQFADQVDAHCHSGNETCAVTKRSAYALLETAESYLAARNPEAEPKRNCYRFGKPCAKAKRDAFALPSPEPMPEADAMAIAEAKSNCYRFGEPCAKAKRDAFAMAEAAAEAMALAEPKRNCYRFGEPCAKAKRQAKVNCYRFGEPCAKLKRAVEEIDALTSDATDAATQQLNAVARRSL